MSVLTRLKFPSLEAWMGKHEENGWIQNRIALLHRQDAPAISCHWYDRGGSVVFSVICTCCDGWVNQTLLAVKLSATVRRTWKSLKSCNLQHIIVQKAKETICSLRRWERRGFFFTLQWHFLTLLLSQIWVLHGVACTMLKPLLCTSGPAPDIWQCLVFQIRLALSQVTSQCHWIDGAQAQSHVLNLLKCQKHSKRRSITSSCRRERSEKRMTHPGIQSVQKYRTKTFSLRDASVNPLVRNGGSKKRGLSQRLVDVFFGAAAPERIPRLIWRYTEARTSQWSRVTGPWSLWRRERGAVVPGWL